MKPSLKILSFTIAVMHFCIGAKAQIVYTDVKPNKTFKDSGAVYHLDLNNDGTNDFDIRDSSHKVNFSGNCNGQHTDYYINIIAQQKNAVLTNSNYYPSLLNLNNIIQANSSYWSNTFIRPVEDAWWICQAPQSGCTFCVWHIAAEHDGNNWTNGTDTYLGLKLIKGSNTYYGWIRLSLYFYVSLSNQDSVSFTVKDYAYNSTPNMPILAGQKNCIAPTVEINADGPLSFCSEDSVILTAEGNEYEYQWMRNGKNISGAMFKNYTAKTAGTYKCEVTNSCGSILSSGKKVSITCNDLYSNAEKIISNHTQLTIAPNPFSNTTIISFSLQQTQKVSISIYDMNGRLVKTLADAQMQAGTHQFIWNVKSEKRNIVASGIYYLRFNAENYSVTKKISVLR